jgi:hypothetical protein
MLFHISNGRNAGGAIKLIVTLYLYHAGCLYAECHYALCHYTDCHYAKRHYAECHCDECHWVDK